MSSDRDRILEQALKHELRAAGTPPTAPPALRSFSEGGCLDADTLGAWTDGALDAAAMAAAEAHVSNCARCLALVGTMARTTPITSGTTATEGTQGAFSLWKWWLAPIAAGVTAVTLWMVVPEQPQLATAPMLSEAAQDTRARVAEEPAPSAAAPAKPKDADANQFAEQYAQRDKLAAAAREDRMQEQPKENQERKEEAPVRQLQENVRLADAAAPPAAPPAAPAATAALQAPQAGALQKNARLAVAAIEIATLDPSLGWRIVGDRIERSDDGGKTWRVTRQNSGDGLTAGSAPSNEVCWFVGRTGRVLRTINGGATFTDVSLAEPLDLSSVAALDGANAMVYSADGLRFRTADGGRTWRLF